MEALFDPETRYYYHNDCAPKLDTLEVVDVDGFPCDECGTIIEDPDPEAAKTLEEEED